MLNVEPGARVIPPAGVAAAVRRLLGTDAEVLEWRVDLIPGWSAARGGVYRVYGTARVAAETRPWSVVLKVVRPLDAELLDRARTALGDASGVEEALRWDREALAYRSGLLDDLPPGLAAARCLGVEERPGDGIWLWFVDLGRPPAWDIPTLGRAARGLGRFGAAYLLGRPLPTRPWLAQEWLWPYARFCAAEGRAVLRDPAKWGSPLARAAFPEPPIGRFERLWAEEDAYRACFGRLPRVLCHHDAHQANLFFVDGADGREQLVAIDWHNVGIGAVGQEIGQLVAFCLKVYTVPGRRADELDAAVFGSYVDGLRDGGWTDDARLARLGYLVALVPRHASHVPQLNMLADTGRHAAIERRRGMAMREIAAHHAAVTAFLLDRADEARALMSAV